MEEKKVPALRFPEFEDTYFSGLLGKITNYVDYRGRGPVKSDEGIQLITARNIKQGYIDHTSKEYVPVKNYSTVMSKGLAEVGDILFTTEAPLGNVAQVVDSNIALAQRVIKFRGKKDIINMYLLHYMLGPVFQKKIKKRAIGTTVQGISNKEVNRVRVNYPIIAEQQKIASFLSAVDTKIEQLTRKKELLEQYKKGVMQKLFPKPGEQHPELRFKQEDGSDFPDWEVKRLGDLTSIYDGTHSTPDYKEFGIPFYSVEHVTANQFEETKYIAEEVWEKENKRVRLEKGDILMTRIGDIGTPRMIDWDVRASFYVSLALIKNADGFLPEYLTQFIQTDLFQNDLWKRTLHVAYPKKINLGEINLTTIFLPNKTEQKAIATFLMRVDEKVLCIQVELEKTQIFKKGLLQQIFV